MVSRTLVILRVHVRLHFVDTEIEPRALLHFRIGIGFKRVHACPQATVQCSKINTFSSLNDAVVKEFWILVSV
jgi:hypothetical protein